MPLDSLPKDTPPEQPPAGGADGGSPANEAPVGKEVPAEGELKYFDVEATTACD